MSLDLAKLTGWATISPAGALASGVAKIGRTGCTDGEFFAAYHGFLADFLMIENPKFVGFEAPLLRGSDASGKATSNVQTAFRLMGLAAITVMKCELMGIPNVWPVNYSSVKAHFTGHGHCTKLQVVEACRARGWTPKDDNEADALAHLDFILATDLARELDLPKHSVRPYVLTAADVFKAKAKA